MSRRPRRREDWGGDGSDDEGDNTASNAPAGLASLRAPKLSSRRGGVAEGDADDSGEDSGVDSGAEGDAAAEDVTSNARERKKATGGRDHEVVGTARMKAQGITMDDKDEEDDEGHAANDDDEEEEKTSSRKPAASADTMGDVGEEAPLDDRAAHRLKMKALFDKNKSDRYMTFDAEDPLKPNPNKRRAAEREDENLEEEDNKDPWVLQAKEDAERAAAEAAKRGGGGTDSIITHFSTHSGAAAKPKAPLVSSTAIFDGEDSAPIFNQAAARVVLLRHMKPGETVLKTVKRLGVPITVGGAGGGAAAVAAPHVVKTKMKNVRSKPKEPEAASATAVLDPVAEKARKLAFAEVTEAAQGFLSSGYVEIYGDTTEKLEKLVQAQRQHEAQVAARNQARAAAAGGAGTGTAAPSAGADARARAAARLQRKRDARAAGLPEPESSDDDDDDDGPAARPAAAASSSASAAAGASSAAAPASAEVQWLYKWSHSETEAQGPFDSSKMASWRSAGLIDNNVVVQRVDPGTSAELAKQTSGQRPWIGIAQVDFQQPDSAPKPVPATNSNSSAAAAADGHAKKKFKF